MPKVDREIRRVIRRKAKLDAVKRQLLLWNTSDWYWDKKWAIEVAQKKVYQAEARLRRVAAFYQSLKEVAQ